MPLDTMPSPSASAAELEAKFGDGAPQDILAAAIGELFPGRIALVSSFGAESVVLLHMVARIDPGTPVLFLDTGMLFPETLTYRDQLVDALGLTQVDTLRPSPRALAAEDVDDTLWRRDSDRCCALRKVAPFDSAIIPFDAWITGRKRYHGGARAGVPVFEPDGARTKVNPLAGWSQGEVAGYMSLHGLPHHPLTAVGYESIGCVPCTSRALPGEASRAGRWRGMAKTECGLHSPRRPQPNNRIHSGADE